MRFALSASYFLWVLFNLRSAAGLPTLYLLDSPASTMFWKDGESYCIDMNHITCYELWNILPLDTWCLIDSHSVPEALVKSDCFILQAASLLYYEAMGPQRAHCRVCSVELLIDIIVNGITDDTGGTLYGGSARDAYSFAHHRKDFEVPLELALCRLQPDSIWVAFCIEPSRSVPEPTSDLLSFFPVDDRKRTVWKVECPSPHLRKRLLNQLDGNYKRAQQTWFYLHLEVSIPGSKAVAACMFNSFYHKHIVHGGSWTLWRMAMNEKGTWRPADEAQKVLIANNVISIDNYYLAGKRAPVQECSFDKWPVREHFSVGVYYHPTPRK
ncbi:hypothetical protein CPB85DRAFT_1341281 [Mucidula mucida]|nr:hypothetical protein CPB85DRAFT_1341281 [Mucidula mucida]